MLRAWCLAVLLALSIWTIGSRAVVCAADQPRAASDVACALNDPSSDDASNRHWEAQRIAACPAASVWTSQLHHAVLASSPSHASVRAPIAHDEPAPQTPGALRSQVQSPLLI